VFSALHGVLGGVSMSGSASPRDVIEPLIQGISEGRWPELDDLYADDA